MANSVTDLLTQSLSPDDSLRQSATQQLEQLASSSFSDYLQALVEQLAAESGVPSHIRNAAGLAIKNSLSARENSTKELYAARWTSLDQGIREKIKAGALSALSSSDRGARNVTSQVISAIAAIELPLGLWPDLITQLLSFVGRADNAGLRQATLQTIGYICEQIRPEVLVAQSNQILTAVIQGARQEEPSAEVQLAAISALVNSLEFIRDNFEREGERNYIMQVVCEATQSSASDVQVAAFECLVKIMQLFYDKMQFYMEKALFGLTIMGMKHEDERVALQAVEFWSTVCDEEIELALQSEEAAAYDEPSERESQHFARIALPEVLPVILQLLMRQEEDATDDEWNVSMAAGTCLALLAQAVGDGIVTPIIPFVESNIKSSDWRQREAAVMAFGSILDGPEEKLLLPLVSQALPTIIEMMQDPNVHVKDSTAWTLGRICDVLIQTIKPEIHLASLVTALVRGLQDSPRVVSNCCWGLMNLAEQLGNATGTTSALSPYFDGVSEALLRFTDQGTNESNSRTSGYEALSAFINYAASDCLPTVNNSISVVLQRAEHMLQMQNQIVGSDDRNNYNEIQMNICSVLTSIIRRLGKGIEPLADRIMTVLLQIIQTAPKQSPVLEDAFLCVGAMISTLETGFTSYLQAFLPFLVNALQSHEEYQLCSIAVGLIGDICRALGDASLPYRQGFMEVLLANLQSNVLHRNVKPPILSCFGDIALAIGGNFEPFLATTINVLQQAGAMRADSMDYDLVDYIVGLRESILEAYTGIVTGLKSSSNSAFALSGQALLPYVPSIFTFLQLALTDQERTEGIIKSGVGLLGDLAEAFPQGQIKPHLQNEWVAEAVKVARTRSTDTEGKAIAKWAKEMIRKATQ